jgi:hypothetical protein
MVERDGTVEVDGKAHRVRAPVLPGNFGGLVASGATKRGSPSLSRQPEPDGSSRSGGVQP